MEQTAKEILIKIIQEQPDDMTSEEILQELAFHQMIDRGLADIQQGKIISHEQIEQEIESWQK